MLSMSWVNGAGGRTQTLLQNQHVWDHSGSQSLSAKATAFVPGCAVGGSSGTTAVNALSLSAKSASFVPGGSWGASWQASASYDEWSDAANDNTGTSWEHGHYGMLDQGAEACKSAVNTVCWFNNDAYGSDSDSSASESPRPSPRPADNGVAAVVGPEEFIDRRPDGQTCVLSDAEMEAPANQDARGGDGPELVSLVARALGANPDQQSGVYTDHASSESDLETAAETEHATTAVESESEWSLPDAAIPSGTQQAIVAQTAQDTDMSETELKRWLQLFADDGDGVALGKQWRRWVLADPAAETKAITWLVQVGLEDCRRAETVLAILTHLLNVQGLRKEIPTQVVAEFSEEAIEDLRLDNPRVDDFIAKLRLARADNDSAPAQTEGVRQRKVPAKLESNDNSESEKIMGATSTTYSTCTLLTVRRLMLADKTVNGSDLRIPTWKTEDASVLGTETPQWAQKMSQANTTPVKGKEVRSGSEDWRNPIRPSKSEDTAKRKKTMNGSIHKEGSTPNGRDQKDALPVSRNSWVAQVRRTKDLQSGSEEDADADARFLRDMRSVLNKLTVEKFDQLSENIIQMVQQSTRPNRGIPVLMKLIFEKATTQHHFISMYVRLCGKLHKWLSELNPSSELESQCNFKRVLLNQCQSSFEQYLEPPEGFDGLVGDELYEMQVKYKTRMLGNIKLVGELIRHGMLAPKVAISVATELARDDALVLEERLETLAVFLETVGPGLDDPTWAHYNDFNKIFSQVEKVVSDTLASARIRFLLRDVLDLRRGKWTVRKVKDLGKDSPMTIAQVHEKARQDQVTPSSTRSSRDQAMFSSLRRRCAGPIGGRPPPLAGQDGGSFFAGQSPATSSKAIPLLRRCTTSNGSSCSSAPPTPPTTSPAVSPGLWPKDAPSSVKGLQRRDRAQTDGSQNIRRKVGETDRPPEEHRLRTFHREVAQVIRQICASSMDVSSATKRLKTCGPLPPGHAVDEAVDFIARVVDETRQKRQRLFELLSSLVSAGVMSPPRILKQAVEVFAKDAFADPTAVDPPDLGDIILSEMLPALAMRPGDIRLPQCLRNRIDT